MRLLYSVIIFMLSCVLLSCSDPSNIKTEDRSNNFALTGELADCKVIKLRDASYNSINVVHCPSSRVTAGNYRNGKVGVNVVVIQREQLVEYESKDECEASLPRNQQCQVIWVQPKTK